jgi:hypothetical protein
MSKAISKFGGGDSHTIKNIIHNVRDSIRLWTKHKIFSSISVQIKRFSYWRSVALTGF